MQELENLNDLFIFLEQLKKQNIPFILSGSTAMMCHLGMFIRTCKDIDLHLDKEYFKDVLDINKGRYQLDFYDNELLWEEKYGFKVIKLEQLITDKIIKLINNDNKRKALNDLFYLLNLSYDKSLVLKLLLNKLEGRA